MRFSTLEELLYYAKYCPTCQLNCCKIKILLNTVYCRYNSLITTIKINNVEILENKIIFNLSLSNFIGDNIFLTFKCDENFCLIENKKLINFKNNLQFEGDFTINSFCNNCNSNKNIDKINFNVNKNEIYKFQINNEYFHLNKFQIFRHFINKKLVLNNQQYTDFDLPSYDTKFLKKIKTLNTFS